ncbi:MAG TPA: GNAT family N-acetyltransferase [Armatimonadota bacterium]|nr:GNAT family N-acetyltransferase [Armatimonadota bacterium]
MSTLTLPRIEQYTDPDISRLEPLWRSLLEKDEDATIFQSWEWCSVWWKHFQARRQPYLLLAYQDDEPVALAPLSLNRVGGGLLRRLEYFGTGVSDYLGFIGDSAHLATCARYFLTHLHSLPGWDLLALQQVNPDQAERNGFSSEPFLNSLKKAGFVARWCEQDICPRLSLPESWEDMLPRLGKKLRYNIGYYERLLRRDYKEVSLETARPEDAREAVEEFLQLHTRRWRKRGLPGALYTRQLQDFHRALAPVLARNGLLALHRLRLDGRTVATLYCFQYNQRAFYYLGGFEPELARYSPGTVLTAYAMRYAIAHGARVFDFLRGRERYKYRWPVEERANYRLDVAHAAALRSRCAFRCNIWQGCLQHAAQEKLQQLLEGK